MFPSFLKGKISGRFCFSEQLQCLLLLQVPGLPSPPFHPGSCCHGGSGWCRAAQHPVCPHPAPGGPWGGRWRRCGHCLASDVRGYVGNSIPPGLLSSSRPVEGEEQPRELGGPDLAPSPMGQAEPWHRVLPPRIPRGHLPGAAGGSRGSGGSTTVLLGAFWGAFGGLRLELSRGLSSQHVLRAAAEGP